MSQGDEKRSSIRTEGGHVWTMAFLIAEDTKRLASAGRNNGTGHRQVFGDDDAYMQLKDTRRRSNCARRALSSRCG